MAIQDRAFFELPGGTHEASHPAGENFGFQEWESEFEEELGHYGTPEAYHFNNSEWGGHSTQETESEEESSFLSGLLGSLLGQGEGEAYDHESEHEFMDESGYTSSPELSHMESSHYGMPAMELEGESDRFLAGLLGSLLSESEGELEHQWMGEGEADRFFGGLFKAISKVAKNAIPIAKKLAPGVASSVLSLIPGAGIAGPLVKNLLGGLFKESEAEVEAMEDHFTSLFANNESVSEAEHPRAYDMALAELFAAEAAMTPHEAEAEAYVGALVPIVVNMMGKGKVKKTLPVMTQANAQIARKLRREGGRSGRDLQRLMPAMNRRAVGMMNKAAQRGQPVDGKLANRAMATAAAHVLGSPRQVRRGIERNIGLRGRVAPVGQRRPMSGGARAGTSMSRQRQRTY